MHITFLHLLGYYAGFGFVLFLFWAAACDYADRNGRYADLVRRLFLIVGIVHPAAAIAAWDLQRIETGEPDRRINAVVGASLVLAAVASLLLL